MVTTKHPTQQPGTRLAVILDGARRVGRLLVLLFQRSARLAGFGGCVGPPSTGYPGVADIVDDSGRSHQSGNASLPRCERQQQPGCGGFVSRRWAVTSRSRRRAWKATTTVIQAIGREDHGAGGGDSGGGDRVGGGIERDGTHVHIALEGQDIGE